MGIIRHIVIDPTVKFVQAGIPGGPIMALPYSKQFGFPYQHPWVPGSLDSVPSEPVLSMSVLTKYTAHADSAQLTINGQAIAVIGPRPMDPAVTALPTTILQRESFILSSSLFLVTGIPFNTLTVTPAAPGEPRGLWVGKVTLLYSDVVSI